MEIVFLVARIIIILAVPMLVWKVEYLSNRIDELEEKEKRAKS